MTTTTFSVAGMTCGHCVSAVTEELRKIDGVTDVAVDLVTGGESNVTVTSATAVDPARIDEAVDEAGYEVVKNG